MNPAVRFVVEVATNDPGPRPSRSLSKLWVARDLPGYARPGGESPMTPIEARAAFASGASLNVHPLSTLISNGEQPYGGRTVNPVNPNWLIRGEGGKITTPPRSRVRARLGEAGGLTALTEVLA